MRINDLEHKTGLDRATIRYYENEGLIQPERLENGYRNYSDEDLEDLLKIKLLRQLGMSLEQIRKLQQGSADFSAALNQHVLVLERKMGAIQRARDVCREMLNDNVSYATLNASLYFEKLTASSATKAIFAKTYHEPAVVVPYHPVRRFAARMLDFAIIETILLLIVVVILRLRPYPSFVSTLISYGAPVLAIPLLAMLLHRFGTTPGKWIMGLEVEHCNGGRLSMSEAIDREWCTLYYGYGLGIPGWSLYRLYKSYRQHKEGPMDWDYSSEYIYHPWKFMKKCALILCVIVLISGNFLIISDIVKPRYRGDLTIAEFASNYNDYMKDLVDSPSGDKLLEEDGSWGERQESPGTVVVTIGNENENPNFTYITEGETVTGIRYENHWTDIMYCNPLGTNTQVAAMTLLMSQRNISYFDLIEFSELWSSIDDQETGSFTYKNVEVSWEIKTVNCMLTSYYGYLAEDQEQESSVDLIFEVIVH